MKLSIERATLLKALAQAQSVVERRNTIPILANVLIEAEGDQASFRATDLDIEVVDRAPAVVERAGATTVSAVTLHDIVRKLPEGALVTLSDDPGAVPSHTRNDAPSLRNCAASESSATPIIAKAAFIGAVRLARRAARSSTVKLSSSGSGPSLASMKLVSLTRRIIPNFRGSRK